MALNPTQLSKDILGALKNVFSKNWPEVKEYAEAEAKKLAQAIVMIEALKVSGKINEEQAALLMDIQKSASRTVLLTIEGLGILTIESAINAALNVIKDTVNTTLGFVLL